MIEITTEELAAVESALGRQLTRRPRGHVTVSVRVEFRGAVKVFVPGWLPQERRESLASKLAMSQVLATVDNPDAPIDDAYEDYCDTHRAQVPADEWDFAREWDGSTAKSVSGVWTVLDVN